MISSSGNTCVKNGGAPTRYGAVAQTLHWLTAILVLGAYLSSVGGPESRIYSDALEPTRHWLSDQVRMRYEMEREHEHCVAGFF
jgi:hypothetical protein